MLMMSLNQQVKMVKTVPDKCVQLPTKLKIKQRLSTSTQTAIEKSAGGFVAVNHQCLHQHVHRHMEAMLLQVTVSE